MSMKIGVGELTRKRIPIRRPERETIQNRQKHVWTFPKKKRWGGRKKKSLFKQSNKREACCLGFQYMLGISFEEMQRLTARKKETLPSRRAETEEGRENN